MPVTPYTLLLPFELADAFSIHRVLADGPAPNGREAYRLLEQFDVSGPERRFVIALLRAKTNCWLFRCNQTQFCGDFVVVDMSGAAPAGRRVVVLELKAGEPVREAGGVQLARWRAAVDEIARTRGVIEVGAPAERVRGGEAEVLEWLGVRRP